MQKIIDILKSFPSPTEMDKIMQLRDKLALSKIPLKIKYGDRSR
jgi:hypothetical protein